MKNSLIKSMIRINHAGEYAAKRIYEGQLKYIKDGKAKALIAEMAKGEEEHLAYFVEQIKARKVRPTALYPLVDKLAYGVGACTALLGKKAAMACTSAVEEVISAHYAEQIKSLGKSEPALKRKIKKFMDDELKHKHIADKYDHISAHSLLHKIIKEGCRVAIRLVRHI